MNIRTMYYKIENMDGVIDWWSAFLEQEPHKYGEAYSEFKIDGMRLGFVFNSFGDAYSGNRGVLMFECSDQQELEKKIDHAKKLEAKMLVDNLGKELNSVVFEDPFGNEFEIGFLGHD